MIVSASQHTRYDFDSIDPFSTTNQLFEAFLKLQKIGLDCKNLVWR